VESHGSSYSETRHIPPGSAILFQGDCDCPDFSSVRPLARVQLESRLLPPHIDARRDGHLSRLFHAVSFQADSLLFVEWFHHATGTPHRQVLWIHCQLADTRRVHADALDIPAGITLDDWRLGCRTLLYRFCDWCMAHSKTLNRLSIKNCLNDSYRSIVSLPYHGTVEFYLLKQAGIVTASVPVLETRCVTIGSLISGSSLYSMEDCRR
jgi:hypothetical protein